MCNTQQDRWFIKVPALMSSSQSNLIYLFPVLISNPCLKRHLVACCSGICVSSHSRRLEPRLVWLKTTAWEHRQENEAMFELFGHQFYEEICTQKRNQSELWVFNRACVWVGISPIMDLFVKFYFESRIEIVHLELVSKPKFWHCDNPRAHIIVT